MQKNNGWTPERRKKQAELIKQWQPWKKSTGPKSVGGKERVGSNAYKGGHRSKLREIIKMVNTQVRASRELVNSCK